jgi:hypothetical protein
MAGENPMHCCHGAGRGIIIEWTYKTDSKGKWGKEGRKKRYKIDKGNKDIILYAIFNGPRFISNIMRRKILQVIMKILCAMVTRCLGSVQASGIPFALPVVESREPWEERRSCTSCRNSLPPLFSSACPTSPIIAMLVFVG